MMVFTDIMRVLVGCKTRAEVEAERKFLDAVESHKGASVEVAELAVRLQKTRSEIYARIDVLKGGSGIDGREIDQTPSGSFL